MSRNTYKTRYTPEKTGLAGISVFTHLRRRSCVARDVQSVFSLRLFNLISAETTDDVNWHVKLKTSCKVVQLSYEEATSNSTLSHRLHKQIDASMRRQHVFSRSNRKPS